MAQCPSGLRTGATYTGSRFMKKAVHCTVNVPILETERLRLRGHRLDDFPASAAMWADPVVTRHTTGKPQTREEVWLRLLRVTLTNLAASSMM